MKLICSFLKKIRQGKVKRPAEFLNVMPYNNKYYRRKSRKHYWIKQIDFEYSQYCGLSETNLQSWLDDKKRIFDSVKKFVRKREEGNILKASCGIRIKTTRYKM